MQLLPKHDWVKNTNIYEVNLRQYTQEGTFNAFAQSLPRLKEMGIKTLWFMPITPISPAKMKGTMGSYYACSDYLSINPEFGSIDDFKNLVNYAHSLEFKVIIDWVANHTGWQHRWTESNPEYYKKDPNTGDFLAASGMDDIIELDYNNPQLREAMINAMALWVKECDIDGFRCDLASWVLVDFWQEARPQVEATKSLFWLGEYDELENPEYATVFDASYSWKWMHQTQDFYENKIPLDTLRWLLQQYESIGVNSYRAWFTTNHDENSWNGTEFEKYGDMVYALSVFSCTWTGIPLLYSGQELPNRKRLAFFDKDVIEWNGHYEMEIFFQKLFYLKSTNKALDAGSEENLPYIMYHDAFKQLFIYHRRFENQEVLVIINFSAEGNIQFDLGHERLNGEFASIFDQSRVNFDSVCSFNLPAWGFLVLEKI